MPDRDYNKDPLTYDESWDLNQEIIIRQDFRDLGADKFVDRLFRCMKPEQWDQFRVCVQDKGRHADTQYNEQLRWNQYEKQVRLGTSGLSPEDMVFEMIRMADDDGAWSFNSGDLSRRDYNKLFDRLFKQVNTPVEGRLP